jgi:hypothetical protein
MKLEVKIECVKTNDTNDNTHMLKLWRECSNEIFSDNINMEDVDNVYINLCMLSDSNQATQTDIDTIVNHIKAIFQNCFKILLVLKYKQLHMVKTKKNMI